MYFQTKPQIHVSPVRVKSGDQVMLTGSGFTPNRSAMSHLRRPDETEYNPCDLMQAMQKAYEWGDRIPLGLIYQSERPTYEESEPVFQQGPLVDQPLGVTPELFGELLAETM